jgi:hypothetical protein
VLSAGKSDLIIPESPTKRRRVDSPTKENTRSSPRKSTIPPTLHLARRSTPELDRSLPHSLPQSEEDESEPEPLRRRFRPVFLDHTQWHARDPRLDKVWKNAEAHSEAMVKLYGHPFERYRPRDTDTRE